MSNSVSRPSDSTQSIADGHSAKNPFRESRQFPGYRIAAIVPCHNEERSVGQVVRDLKASVEGIEVYVYDNCSVDRTGEVAAAAGAHLRHETAKGKGNVVRRAFSDIEADIYLLIDGDDTYDAWCAPALIDALLDGPYDHVLGIRAQDHDAAESAYRPGHEMGNRVLNRVVAHTFGANVGDMLSGYRVFSRRFVKSFPAVSREFEIETELTVHCLALRVPSAACQVGFRDRQEGSESKLRTYRDGWRILRLILNLARHERPIAFYGAFSLVFAIAAIAMSVPLVVRYARTGLVPQTPTLVLTLVLCTICVILIMISLVLDGIRKSRHEGSRLAYLSHPVITATSARFDMDRTVGRTEGRGPRPGSERPGRTDRAEIAS